MVFERFFWLEPSVPTYYGFMAARDGNGAMGTVIGLLTELKEGQSDLEASLGARIDQTNARLDGLEASLGARIDHTNASLGARIDHTNASLGARIDQTNHAVAQVAEIVKAGFERTDRAIQANARAIHANTKAINHNARFLGRILSSFVTECDHRQEASTQRLEALESRASRVDKLEGRVTRLEKAAGFEED